LNEHWKELLEKIKPSCESISKSEEGILVKLKPMPFPQFFALQRQLLKAGAVHQMQAFTFLLPDPASSHLARLRGVFRTSQAEIRESIMFLAENGFTPDQISSETGASLTTIYRNLGKR
jgi:hypothetical protein